MIMNRNVFYVIAVLLKSTIGIAQDPHFTQFYDAPLSINPSYVGDFIYGSSKVLMNSRTQWVTSNNPFFTNSVTFLKKMALPESRNQFHNTDDLHNFSLGGMMMNDRSQGGALQRNSATIAASYQQMIDNADAHHFLGMGFSGTYRSDRTNYSSLTWGNQISNAAFNMAIPSGEPIRSVNSGLFQMAAGINYISVNDERRRVFELGASCYNFNRPKMMYSADSTLQYPIRYSLHGFYTSPVNDMISIFIYGIYQNQGRVEYAQLGGRMDYSLNISGGKIGMGGWYRTGGVIIPYLSFSIQDFTCNMTYDIISIGEYKYNSVELSFSYIFY